MAVTSRVSLANTPIDYTDLPGETEIAWSNRFASMTLVPSVHGPHIAVARPSGSKIIGAGILISDGSSLLMVRQARWANRVHTWEIPAGAVNAGEDPADGAAREVAEETGVLVASAALVPLGGIHGEPARTYATTNMFFCQIDPTTATADIVEVSAAEWVDIDTVVDAAISGELQCAQATSAILRARLRGLI